MIRKATPNDLERIYSLYRANSLNISNVTDPTYAAKIQQDGFLLALEDKTELLERIQNNFLFNVYEIEQKVVGFLNINKEIYFPEDADNIIWFDDELKRSYYHNNSSITLHEIVVDPSFKGQGFGRELLENSLNTLKEKHYTDLFSIVAFAPLTNCASIIFHTRNGFERTCVSMPDDLFGLQNYQSVLFHLPIKCIQ
jgi:ribosomal protein S18 acetylase RimI-like enzyme